MKIIDFSDEEIRLCTGLDEEAFAKTRYSLLLSTKGVLAECSAKENPEKAEFTFSSWQFDSIKSFAAGSGAAGASAAAAGSNGTAAPSDAVAATSDAVAAPSDAVAAPSDAAADSDHSSGEKVYFCGKLPEGIKSTVLFAELCNKLAEIKDGGANIPQKDASSYADDTVLCSAVFSAINQGIRQKLELPVNGGGIIAAKSEKKIYVLFLPEEIFYNSVKAFSSQEKSQLLDWWTNPLLKGKEALCFMEAAAAYKILAGNFPYAAENEEKRMEDVTDTNFVPLELLVNGIKPSFARKIDFLLSQKPEQKLTATEPVDFRELLAEKLAPSGIKLSEEDFKKKQQEAEAKQNGKITLKRKIRRYSLRIAGIAAAVLFIAAFAISTAKTNAGAQCSIGLTSTQTIQCFYQSINQKDVQLISTITKGKCFNSYVSAVTNMHVINTTAQAYTMQSANVQPQTWLFYATDEASDKKTSIYGVSNLLIDDVPANLDVQTHSRKDKIPPLEKENGITLTKESRSVHSVEYFIIETDGESGQIHVEKISGTITLSFIKNMWILTDIKVQSEAVPFNTAEFKSDYYQVLQNCGGDVLKAAQLLSFRYLWIPSQTVLQNEKDRLSAVQTDMN